MKIKNSTTMILSKKSTFRGILTYPINAAQRSIAFYYIVFIKMFTFYHFPDSLYNIKKELIKILSIYFSGYP